MRLCDGFAGHDQQVTVVYPFTYMKENIAPSAIPASYGLRHAVHRRILLTPLLEHSPSWWRFVVLLAAFSVAALRICITGILTRRHTLLVSRDAKSLIPALLLRKLTRGLFPARVVYVASEVKKNRIYRWVVKNSDGVMAGVTSTREAIQKLVPVPDHKFMLSLAPVPEPLIDCSKEEARNEIGYSDTKPLVVYTGKLGTDVHELRYIFQAAKQLPEYMFLFTGGRPSAVEAVKSLCREMGVDNVIFTGFFNDSTYVRYYQLAADVLVSYYTSKDHLVEFNYPQKVNEYMTTGNVVVTPDFPATRDVLNDRNVIFVKPDDPLALAAGLRRAVEDPEQSGRLAHQAKEDLKALTFERRTAEFLAFAERL